MLSTVDHTSKLLWAIFFKTGPAVIIHLPFPTTLRRLLSPDLLYSSCQCVLDLALPKRGDVVISGRNILFAISILQHILVNPDDLPVTIQA